jgi:hypothetical protein
MSAVAVARLMAVLAAWSGSASAQDVSCLSDEFNDAGTASRWLRVHETEQWFADQLEHYSIDSLEADRLVMMPYTCTWFRDYRGPMSYKLVSGDFAITSDVRVTSRGGSGPPASYYSLAGLMIRTPRDITPATWTAGDENYVFLSLGYGQDSTVHYQFEVKTTIDSDSVLNLSPASGGNAQLQIARLGEYVIALLREPSQQWRVHRRYHRPDMPAELQAGMVSYTDWNKVQYFDPFTHNQTVITPPLPSDPNPGAPFFPDLVASFDYARFVPVSLPPELVGVDLTSSTLVPDSALLAFLGASANHPGPGDVEITDHPDDATVMAGDDAVFAVAASGGSLSYQWRLNGVDLADGPLASGAVISGSNTTSLTLASVTIDEFGAEIACEVSGPCDGELSEIAILTVTCPSDFDGSGFVDTDDFDAFVNAFIAGGDDADFDGSRFVDTDDFDAFVHAFEGGC